MGPIKFNLSAGLMVCLLATLVAAIAVPAGRALAVRVPNDATANRKLTADGGPKEEAQPTAAIAGVGNPAQPCQEACSKKHFTQESLCPRQRDCSACQRRCILEDLSPAGRNASHRLALVLLQMTRNESLVTADVAWVSAPDSRPRANRTRQQQQQCLVTWEVSGGGLMGNLLTESSTVQLSLWPDTNYRVQVTCRNKQTEALVRSAPIVLNTVGAATVHPGDHDRRTHADPGGEDNEVDSQLSVGLEEIVAEDHPSGSGTVRRGTSSYRETVLFGVYFTMLVFLLVLLAVISFIRPKTPASDRAVLVKNDAIAKQTEAAAAAGEILHV